MAHDVFISYSTQDKAVATAMCAALEKHGVRCWMAPRDILPGRDWGESIVEAIGGARVMVLVFSGHSNGSDQCKREVQVAAGAAVAILPFRIEDVTPIKSLQYFLGTQHWLDALTPPLERHLDLLSESVQTLLRNLNPEDAPREGAGVAQSVAPSSAAAGARPSALSEQLRRMREGKQKKTQEEYEKLQATLAKQLDAGSYPEANETVAAILRLVPGDSDALEARVFIQEQLPPVPAAAPVVMPSPAASAFAPVVKVVDTGRAPQNFDGIEFVWVPPGSFLMGSPVNEPGRQPNETQHKVTISRGFWLGKYEVTQAQWQTVMGSNPSHFKGDNLPVETVSWNDAQQFISTLNKSAPGLYRLPTEAEWEYACRAGSTGAYAYGDGDGPFGEFAWYFNNSGNSTHPVGQKRPNAWGLHDMHGNVWEWCQDWFGDYPDGNVTDPTGPNAGHHRVLRGGSWADNAISCSASERGRGLDFPDGRSHDYGFRVVRTQ